MRSMWIGTWSGTLLYHTLTSSYLCSMEMMLNILMLDLLTISKVTTNSATLHPDVGLSLLFFLKSLMTTRFVKVQFRNVKPLATSLGQRPPTFLAFSALISLFDSSSTNLVEPWKMLSKYQRKKDVVRYL